MTTQIKVPLKWTSRADLPTVYANQLSLTVANGDFVLTFGEAVAEPGLGTAPEEGVPVLPVARIAMGATSMMNVARVIHNVVADFAAQAEPDHAGAESEPQEDDS